MNTDDVNGRDFGTPYRRISLLFCSVSSELPGSERKKKEYTL